MGSRVQASSSHFHFLCSGLVCLRHLPTFANVETKVFISCSPCRERGSRAGGQEGTREMRPRDENGFPHTPENSILLQLQIASPRFPEWRNDPDTALHTQLPPLGAPGARPECQPAAGIPGVTELYPHSDPHTTPVHKGLRMGNSGRVERPESSPRCRRRAHARGAFEITNDRA